METTELLTSILDIFNYYRPGGQSTFLFEKTEIYDRYLVRYSFIGNVGAYQLRNWHPTNQWIYTHRKRVVSWEVVMFLFFGFWHPLVAWNSSIYRLLLGGWIWSHWPSCQIFCLEILERGFSITMSVDFWVQAQTMVPVWDRLFIVQFNYLKKKNCFFVGI